MEEWKEYRLGDIITISSGFPYKGEFIGCGDNYILGMGCVSFKETFLPSGMRSYSSNSPERYLAYPGDIVLATRQQSDNMPILGMPAIIPNSCSGKNLIIGANLYKVQNNSEFSNSFLFWLLKSPAYVQHIKSCQTGSTVRMITKANIENFYFYAPQKEERNKISNFLWNIERKIELNRQINDNLEQQAQALFNHYFVENTELLGEYDEVSLLDIASYTNGLAMQKYRPSEDETSYLPVMKIKELGQGFTDSNSDICTCNIPEIYIINSGDIIFSWSGTLMVKIWCGETAGLNQHLFKVYSESYEKWFYYFWTKYHLRKFINIAKDKAVTMGHIKREDLAKSKVILPNQATLQNLNKIFSPIMNSIINNEIESKQQVQLRDILLPRLMSGELKINEINC